MVSLWALNGFACQGLAVHDDIQYTWCQFRLCRTGPGGRSRTHRCWATREGGKGLQGAYCKGSAEPSGQRPPAAQPGHGRRPPLSPCSPPLQTAQSPLRVCTHRQQCMLSRLQLQRLGWPDLSRPLCVFASLLAHVLLPIHGFGFALWSGLESYQDA